MRETTAKLDKALIALNKGTLARTIKWQSVIPKEIPGLAGYDTLEGKIYRSEYKGKILCIYRYGTRYYVDEDEWHPTECYRLLFVDNDFKEEWVFPDNRAIRDLYDSVTFQISDADRFFDDCINDLSGDDLKDENLF